MKYSFMPCGIDEVELKKRKDELKPLLMKVRLKQSELGIERANYRLFLQFKVNQAKRILKFARELFGDNLAVAFSGGKDSLVSLHLALKIIGPNIKVIYNHTTVEFPETIRYVTCIAKNWGLDLHIAKPEKSFFSAVIEKGWASHENRWCCRPYKDEPAHNFMVENSIVAEVTGTVRTESIYRRSLKPFMPPKRNPSIIRVHPIYDWNEWDVWRYIKENELPYNPLYDIGYRRIGCWCCPINGLSHYKRLQRTHPKLFSFLCNFKPKHPSIVKLEVNKPNHSLTSLIKPKI